MSHHPLRLLLEFDDRIQRDREQAPAFLHRRDRRFALDCQQQGIRPDAAAWLAHMQRLSGPGSASQANHKLELQWQRIQRGFIAAGALFGVITMAGLLFYDGGQRINITVFLAFVLLQLLLAAATTVQAVAGWQPWGWLHRRLQPQLPGQALAHLQPLLMARAAHAGGYHTLVRALATPWGWLWPAAVPSQELVEATRFFRAAPDSAGTAPAQWGQWWPFVVMLWLTWVMVPRLMLLAFSHWLITHKAVRILQQHPGMQALAWRMETPTLDTGNQHNDADDLPDTTTRARTVELSDTDHIVCWAGAGEPELPQQLLGNQTQILKAGGRASLEEDDRVLATLAQALAQSPEPSVMLITRSWEPPTGELHDFLDHAREQWPENTRVLVLPLAPNANRPPAEHLIQPWLRFTERLPAGFAQVTVLPTLPDNPYQTGNERP